MFHPPRDLPMLCGSVRLPRPGAVGMHLGAGAVEAEAVRVPAGRMQVPKRGEQPLEHAAARPAAEPGVDRVPFSEALRQGAPFAAVLQEVQNRIDDCDVRNPDFDSLTRFQRRFGFSERCAQGNSGSVALQRKM